MNTGPSIWWPTVVAEKAADILQQAGDADPGGDLAGERFAGQTLRREGALQHRAEQIVAEEADAPQADDAGEGQQESHDGIAAPARVAEQLAIGAHLYLLAARLERSEEHT